MLDRCRYISVCVCDNIHMVVSLSSHPFCASSAHVCIVQPSDCYSGSDAWLGICELMVPMQASLHLCLQVRMLA